MAICLLQNHLQEFLLLRTHRDINREAVLMFSLRVIYFPKYSPYSSKESLLQKCVFYTCSNLHVQWRCNQKIKSEILFTKNMALDPHLCQPRVSDQLLSSSKILCQQKRNTLFPNLFHIDYSLSNQKIVLRCNESHGICAPTPKRIVDFLKRCNIKWSMC